MDIKKLIQLAATLALLAGITNATTEEHVSVRHDAKRMSVEVMVSRWGYEDCAVTLRVMGNSVQTFIATDCN